jgi:hypothetical protein
MKMALGISKDFIKIRESLLFKLKKPDNIAVKFSLCRKRGDLKIGFSVQSN